jgi:hypothetical protein
VKTSQAQTERDEDLGCAVERLEQLAHRPKSRKRMSGAGFASSQLEEGHGSRPARSEQTREQRLRGLL